VTSRAGQASLRETIPSAMNIKLKTLLIFASLGTCLVGFDCAGGVHECEPPAGTTLYDQALFCQGGVRGYCSAGGHQGDELFNEVPCPTGSQCTMQNDRVVCLKPDGTVAPEGTGGGGGSGSGAGGSGGKL